MHLLVCTLRLRRLFCLSNWVLSIAGYDMYVVFAIKTARGRGHHNHLGGCRLLRDSSLHTLFGIYEL